MNAQTWLDDGLLCPTKWHLWPSQPLTFDSGLTLTPEQTRYTVALNPFLRACVGKSRESSLSPSPWHTQRENGSFGRPAQGRKNRAQRGGPCRKGERRRGGDSAKGYSASIQAEGPLFLSSWWIASGFYQPPILKIFMSILAMFIMLTFYTEYLADVLCLTKRTAWHIMHCTDFCIPECSALDFPIQCEKWTIISPKKNVYIPMDKTLKHFLFYYIAIY